MPKPQHHGAEFAPRHLSIDDVIETADAAKILGVSTQRVRQLCKRGDLRPVKLLRNGQLFDAAEVHEYARKSRPSHRPKKSS